MAEVQEELILKISLDKEATENGIDELTNEITDLTKANAVLIRQQAVLAKAGKENSAEFLENSKQIEINKQKVTQATATRKNLIASLQAEDDSIKGLNIRNAELKKQRDLLSTSTVSGRKAIAEINAELDANNKTIKENVSGLEQQKIGVGGYTDALDKLVPGLGATVNGIKGMTSAAVTFLATPLGAVLGAIGLAIAAVTAYFKGSEEGQNKFNRLASIGSAILEQFLNVVESVGGAIVAAFEKPQEAVKALWETIKENIVNRVVGLFELFPKLGKAIDAAFKGNFIEAATIAGDAVAKVALGVDNLSGKIKAFAAETAALVEQGIANGEKIAALNAKIDKDERDLIVNRAKIGLEVSKLREAALQQEGEARKKILLEAIALEQQLSNQEVGLAKIRKDLAQTELEANGDDKEAKKALAEATAAQINAEATAFQNTLRFRKEIAAIDEQIEKERLARLKRIQAAEEQMNEASLEAAIKQADTVEERVNLEVTLEQFKAQELLRNDELLAQEREAIVDASTRKITEIRAQGVADIIAEESKLKEVRITANAEAVQFEIAKNEEILANTIEQNGATEDLLLEQEALKKEALDERIRYEQEIETNRAATLLANDELTETGRQTIIEQSQAKQTAITSKGELDRYKIETETAKKIADQKKLLRDQEIQGSYMVANATLGLLKEVFGESKAFSAAQAGLNTAQGITNALAMSGPPWVGIAMSIIIGALGAVQIAKIAGIEFARGGMLMKKFFGGGVARTGGMLSGPSHAQGGIPFSVGGQMGFEAEGGEAIINKKSSKMFRNELSAINQAGGGVAFARGGLLAFGGVAASTQTSSAAARAQSQLQIQDTMKSVFENLPPTIVTVEDINARTQEYGNTVNQAQVI